MNTTFYLFRHGLATKSITGYGENIINANLLSEGKNAIEKLGKFLQDKPMNYFASSEFPRCVQTAEIIQKQTGNNFKTDTRLNEYYQTSFGEFIQKIQYFLEYVEKEKYENVWICTHVAVIIAIKKLLTNEQIIESDLFSNFPLPGTLTVISKNKTEEIDFNK